MKKADITYIEEMIEKADSSGESDDYKKISEELNKLDSKYQNDDLLYYYKGLVCYLDTDTETFRIKWAIDNFKKSISLNPNHFMSRVYLGHCYFDLGEYRKTVQHLYEVLTEENCKILVKNGQSWRMVNMVEIITICHMKLNQMLKFYHYYQLWKEAFYLYSKKEDFYFPESLVVEISNYLKAKGDEIDGPHLKLFRQISLDLIGIIKGGDGFEEIYATELNNLKNWDGHKKHELVLVCR